MLNKSYVKFNNVKEVSRIKYVFGLLISIFLLGVIITPSIAEAKNESNSEEFLSELIMTAEESSKETPEELPEETPEESSKETSGESSKETPEELPEETPEELPEETSGESPEETPEESPEETPGESSKETPEESPEETPEESSKETNVLLTDDQSLSSGSRNNKVQNFKENLKLAGFGMHWNSPTNYYGPDTVRVVKDFQEYYNLTVTGEANITTLNQLESILTSPYQLGKRSQAIQNIKKDLVKIGFADWSNPTILYGSETASIIKNFQKHFNLPVSGIVDGITLSVIQNYINELENRKLIVYLDVGHGSSDTGAYYGGIAEREINLSVSRKIASRLKTMGYEVVLSRNSINNSYSENPRDDLFARPAHANQIGADIFVSVHHNAMPGNSTVSGIETYYYGASSQYKPLPENQDSHNDPKRIADSIKLASRIHDQLIGFTGALNRGVRSGAYVVVRETKMPAVLLELGYMTNPLELQHINSNSYQNTLADSIVKGINSYFSR